MSPTAFAALSWFTIFSSVLLSLGCQHLPPPPKHPESTQALVRRSQPVLGTFVTITAYGSTPELTSSAVESAFDAIRAVDLLLSVHRSDSEAARVNASAGTGPITVSSEFLKVVQAAHAVSLSTDGAFDITTGPLSRLWGFLWKEYRLPTPAELAATLPKTGFRQLRIHPESSTLELPTPGMSLDFGGIGKGYAVDQAVAALHTHGVTNVMVKAGGDVRVSGHPPGLKAWTILIEDPSHNRQRRPVLLRDAALSTSGNYENFFIANGQRYSHILDPRSGLPVQGIASCTVVAPTCTESDALATACFVLGPKSSLQRFGIHRGILFLLQKGQGRAPSWDHITSEAFRRLPSPPTHLPEK